jgi:hypothetical protein
VTKCSSPGMYFSEVTKGFFVLLVSNLSDKKILDYIIEYSSDLDAAKNDITRDACKGNLMKIDEAKDVRFVANGTKRSIDNGNMLYMFIPFSYISTRTYLFFRCK